MIAMISSLSGFPERTDCLAPVWGRGWRADAGRAMRCAGRFVSIGLPLPEGIRVGRSIGSEFGLRTVCVACAAGVRVVRVGATCCGSGVRTVRGVVVRGSGTRAVRDDACTGLVRTVRGVSCVVSIWLVAAVVFLDASKRKRPSGAAVMVPSPSIGDFPSV